MSPSAANAFAGATGLKYSGGRAASIESTMARAATVSPRASNARTDVPAEIPP